MHLSTLTTALVVVLLLQTVPTWAGTPPMLVDGDPATTERVGEADPVDFAIAISASRFEDGAADVVVLSRDDEFADSLAGAPLTADGPLLFTQTAVLPGPTADEIDRVLADDGEVLILGGQVAVSAAVEDQLVGAGLAVRRLQGPSRIETAVAVAQEVRSTNPDGSTVAVARAFGVAGNPTAAWADSVSAGAWAASERVPVVVSSSDQLAPAVADFLAGDDPQQTVVLGGEAALSAAVEAAVPNPRRIAGPSRDATAALIATELLDVATTGPRTVLAFNAFAELGWTRGLAAAGLGLPVLALNQAGIPPGTVDLVSGGGAQPQLEQLVLGPVSEISEQLVAELEELDAGPSAPPRRTFDQPQLIASEMLNQGSRIDGLDLGTRGDLVAFGSSSNDLGERPSAGPNSPGTGDVFIYDVPADDLVDISDGSSSRGERLGFPANQSVGQDRYVLWNGQGSTGAIVRHDRFTGRSEAVLSFEEVTDGLVIGAELSPDGGWLAYDIDGRVFRRPVLDAQPAEEVTARVEGQGDIIIGGLSVARDAARLAAVVVDEETFDRQAVLLTPGGAPTIVSRGPDGEPAEGGVDDQVTISADGSVVLFTSRATNLAPDVDGGTHLYAYDVATAQLRLVDRRPDGTPSFGVRSVDPMVTDDGSAALFASDDAAFFPGEESPGAEGVISADLATGTTRLELDIRTLPGAGPIVSIADLALSGDGRRIAAAITGGSVPVELYLFDRP